MNCPNREIDLPVLELQVGLVIGLWGFLPSNPY